MVGIEKWILHFSFLFSFRKNCYTTSTSCLCIYFYWFGIWVFEDGGKFDVEDWKVEKWLSSLFTQPDLWFPPMLDVGNLVIVSFCRWLRNPTHFTVLWQLCYLVGSGLTMTNNLPEPDDAPWLNLSQKEVEWFAIIMSKNWRSMVGRNWGHSSNWHKGTPQMPFEVL